jgi:hypothetical protein
MKQVLVTLDDTKLLPKTGKKRTSIITLQKNCTGSWSILKSTNPIKKALELFNKGYRTLPKKHVNQWYLVKLDNSMDICSERTWRLVRNLEKQSKRSTPTV